MVSLSKCNLRYVLKNHLAFTERWEIRTTHWSSGKRMSQKMGVKLTCGSERAKTTVWLESRVLEEEKKPPGTDCLGHMLDVSRHSLIQSFQQSWDCTCCPYFTKCTKAEAIPSIVLYEDEVQKVAEGRWREGCLLCNKSTLGMPGWLSQ